MKKRVWLAKGYGSFQSAWRTLQGIETVHMIRKGRVRWLAKGDTSGPNSLHRLAARPRYLTLFGHLTAFAAAEIPSPKLRNETPAGTSVPIVNSVAAHWLQAKNKTSARIESDARFAGTRWATLPTSPCRMRRCRDHRSGC